MAVEKKPINTTPTSQEVNAEGKTPAEQPKPIDPSKAPGNYAIVTESGGQRRVFAVFHGTVQIVPASALGGAFELK